MPDRISADWDFIEIQFEKSAFYSHEWKHSGPRFGVHAPYYITLTNPKPQKFDDAVIRIIKSAEVAYKLNADIVVARLGFYSKQAPEEAMKLAVKGCEEILAVIDVPLGVETQPKRSQFGTLAEVLELSQKVGTVPVLDLPAIKQREKLDLKILQEIENPYIHFNESIGLEKLAAALPETYTLVGETVSAAEAMKEII